MAWLLIDFILLGLAGGLLGVFYRNCLKGPNMIFNFIYYDYLKKWAELEEDLEEAGVDIKLTKFDKFLAWVSYPLGNCIYCSSTWITFILCALYLSSWECLPCWQDIVLGVVMASGIQHLVILIACRFIIYKHPDY